jgi:hypothetical protein
MAKPAALTVTVPDISTFIAEVTKYASSSAELKCYRGQQNAKWDAIPSLMRTDLVGLERCEKRAIRDLMSVHPNEFSEDKTMFDRLVRMQHFGLPTRLMDVSVNPLIALYFATEDSSDHVNDDGKVVALSIPSEREKYFDSDSVACIANLANMTAAEKDRIVKLRGSRELKTPTAVERVRINDDPTIQRLHQFIKEEKAHFLPIIHPIDLFKPYYVHPKMSNRRILAQSGGFIIYGLQPPRPINFKQRIISTYFVIPAKCKSIIRGSLNLLGINESTVYPELDRAAKRIKASYAFASA